jgi:hypothetical protein
MTAKSKLLRVDNVLIIVDDLEAANAFAELGMELEGETTVEGVGTTSSRSAMAVPTSL